MHALPALRAKLAGLAVSARRWQAGTGVGGSRAGTRREWDGAGGVVAGIACGEEAFDGAFDAGDTLGQGLDVRLQVRQIGPDFGSQGLVVGARVTPNGQQQANRGRAYG